MNFLTLFLFMPAVFGNSYHLLVIFSPWFCTSKPYQCPAKGGCKDDSHDFKFVDQDLPDLMIVLILHRPLALLDQAPVSWLTCRDDSSIEGTFGFCISTQRNFSPRAKSESTQRFEEKPSKTYALYGREQRF